MPCESCETCSCPSHTADWELLRQAMERVRQDPDYSVTEPHTQGEYRP